MQKCLLALVLVVGVFISAKAQEKAPQALKYQAVIRDLKGEPLANRNDIDIVVSIRKDNTQGSIVYSESHYAVSSNAFGLVFLEIGRGTPQSGLFANIAWGTSSHFLQIEVELDNNGYTSMGVSELLSVPYALYAETSGSSQISFDGLSQDILPRYDAVLKTFVNSSIKQTSNGNIELNGKVAVNSPTSVELNSAGQLSLNASKIVVMSPSSLNKEYSFPTARGLSGQYLMLKDANGTMGWGDGGGGTSGSFDHSQMTDNFLPVWDNNILRLRDSRIYFNADSAYPLTAIKNSSFKVDGISIFTDTVFMQSHAIAQKKVFLKDGLSVDQLAVFNNGMELNGNLQGNHNVMTKTLTHNKIWLGDATGIPSEVGLSGGISIAQDGTVTLIEKDPKVGSFTPTQVAYWDATSQKLEGSSNLFDDGITVSVGGNLQIGGDATVEGDLVVNEKSTLGETQVKSLEIKNQYYFPLSKGLPYQVLMLNTSRDSLLWKTFVGKNGVKIKEDTLIGAIANLEMKPDPANDTIYSVLEGNEFSKVGLQSYMGVWKNKAGNIYNNGDLITTLVGIGTEDPKARLHIEDGDFLVRSKGTVAPGGISISGAGDRMLWVADKAAFRAGGVQGNQWDIDNIGSYSTVLGFNSIAKGDRSFALGDHSYVTGPASFSIGTLNKIDEASSYVVGSTNTATVVGAYIFGEANTASGVNSIVIGRNNIVSSANSLSLGNNVYSPAASSNTIAIGLSARAGGNNSIVIGTSDNPVTPALTTAADYSIAMGHNSSTIDSKSIAIGYLAKGVNSGSSESSVSIGNTVNASDGGVAIGGIIPFSNRTVSMGTKLTNTSAARNSVNIGISNTLNSSNSVLIGTSNNSSASSQILIGTSIEGGAAATSAISIGSNFTQSKSNVYNNHPYSILMGSAAAVMSTSLDVIYPHVLGNINKPAFTIYNATAPEDAGKWGRALMIMNTVGDLYIRKDLVAVGTVHASGVNTSSDSRLKSNIKNLTTTNTQFLDSIQGVSYTLNSDKNKVLQYGFIAQEVQKYYPHLVSKNGEYLSLNYTAFVPLLWEIAKDQKSEINELKNQIQQMQQQLDAIKILLESK